MLLYICCSVTDLLLIFLWFSFAVLQVACENKFMLIIRRKGPSFICSYTKFEVDSSIRSEVIRVPKFRNCSHDLGHAHLEVLLSSIRRNGSSSISVSNLKQVSLIVQKLIGVPKHGRIRYVRYDILFLCKQASIFICHSVITHNKAKMYIK